MNEKLKNLYKNMSGRERALFYATIGVFVLMLTDLLVLNPIMSHIKVMEAEIKAKSQAIQRDLRILSFKESILKEYLRFERFLDTGEKTQEEIIASLLKKLESLAAQNSIKITNVMPGEIEDKPIYKVYKTTLDYEGTLKNVLTFINQLEESDNLFQIPRYLMTPKNKSGQELKVTMDVTRILITAEDMSVFQEAIDDLAGSEPPPAEVPAPAVPEMPAQAAPAPSGTPAPEPI